MIADLINGICRVPETNQSLFLKIAYSAHLAKSWWELTNVLFRKTNSLVLAFNPHQDRDQSGADEGLVIRVSRVI
jgi:hypothetical protein